MFPKKFQKLINHFASLPSVGPKMAERLVLYLFKKEKEEINSFADDLYNFANGINYCSHCYHISEEQGLCAICKDKNRDKKVICVTEDPLDVVAIEKTKQFQGRYHVLGGNLSVMNQEEIKQLKINELIKRAKEESIKEVIIATNPTTDGETTALYLARLLRPLKIKVTRLGRGMPTGGDIEYADEITLKGALENRSELK